MERDEPLFEISTDKVDTEIPSPAAGVLSEMLVQEGTTVAINTIVARIGDANGALRALLLRTQAAPPPPAPQPRRHRRPPPPASAHTVSRRRRSVCRARRSKPHHLHAPTPSGAARTRDSCAAAAAASARERQADGSDDQGPLSPLVRKMAREYNIDLVARPRHRRRRPHHEAGRRSVYVVAGGKYVRRAASEPMASSAGPYPVNLRRRRPARNSSAMPLPLAETAKTRTEPMSTMRQKIAEHMIMSKRTSAHVTTVHHVDMTKIAKLRDKSKAEFQARNGFSLTFLPFVTAAAAEALRAFPIFNASIDGKNIVYYRDINLGIAVALEGGLIVPVIRNADEKNVAGLQRSIVDLATRARSRQLKPDEVQGGTFSITNFGSFGSIFATPVINQPQVAILGVGAVEKVPAVIEGDAIAIRSQAHLALTFDHRLIDGALADQFCQKVKSILENWSANIL